MSFTCPKCVKSGSLVIEATIELPPDNRSDEIALQVVACAACDFSGLAVYQESRRGAFGSESWDHYGYKVSQEVVDSFAKVIRSCPNPRNAKCKCAAHKRLAVRDRYGRWHLPQDVESNDVFAMHLG